MPLLVQKQVILKKEIASTSNLYAAATSCKKSETFFVLIFHKTWKTSFWTHFGPFSSKAKNKVIPYTEGIT